MKKKLFSGNYLLLIMLFVQVGGFAQKSVYYDLINKGINHTDSLGRPEGIWLLYTEGQNDLELVNYKDGRFNGAGLNFRHFTTPFSDTVLISTVGYKNDTLDGPYKSYYESGNLQESSTIKMGVPDSMDTYYYQSGRVYIQKYHRSDAIDSFIRVFDESGNIKYEHFFARSDIADYTEVVRLMEKEGEAFPLSADADNARAKNKEHVIITGQDILEKLGMVNVLAIPCA